MKIQPKSLKSQSSSSTKVVAEFLESALNETVDPANLRKTYQTHFQTLLNLENSPIDFVEIQRVLDLFQGSFASDENASLTECLEQELLNTISFITIQGAGEPQVLDFGDSPDEWVRLGIAEPGIIDVLKTIKTPTSTLLSLAAGAECAPTKAWLAAGGIVIPVMRQNPQKWLELIQYARQSSGTLIIPLITTDHSSDLQDNELANIAGIDLVGDLELLPAILRESIRVNHTVIGAYAYAPGSTHLVVQAVQDAFIAYASRHYTPEQVSFHWLATPTDSQLLPAEFEAYAISRYQHRSFFVKIRDSIWKIFGQLKRPHFVKLGSYVIVDSSVQKQGFNYQIAKRTQRLRAHLLCNQGFKVAYSVTPPATTDSVLDHRILIASYRGAPRYGLHPFDKDLIGSLGMQQCLHVLSHDINEHHEMYSKIAVHGGLWRMRYDPQTVWVPATISGLLGLLIPKNRAFRSVSLTKR
jgi:hypothetical protein